MNANLQFLSRPTIQSSFPNAMKRFHSCVAPLRAALSVVLLGTCALQMSPVFGQATPNPPERMTYQGFLVDANGTALGNTSPRNYDVVFRIFTDQTVGEQLWAEQQTVTVDKGYFSVLLGEGADIGDPKPALSTLFKGAHASDRYVAIRVKGIGPGNTDLDIQPRLRLLTSPYAFLAQQAVKLVKQNGNDLLTSDGGAITVSGTITANSFTGTGSGLTGLNASELTSGAIPDNRLSSAIARRNESNVFLGEGNFQGHLRVGEIINGTGGVPGYGDALVFSGAPAPIGFNSDNTDPLWLARYNAGPNASELRVTIGDDPGSVSDKLVVGTTIGGNFNQTGNWEPKVTIDARGFMGLNGRSADYPLAFPNTLGDKISLWGNANAPHYGFGIQNSTLQIHSDVAGSVIAFGYGSSGSFVETGRIDAGALYVRHPSVPQLQLSRTGSGTYANLYHEGTRIVMGLTGSHWGGAGYRYATYDGDSNWDFNSDRRLKRDIVDAPPLLDRAMKVQVRNFRWKDGPEDSKAMIGVIAQELQPLFPDMVSETENPETKEKSLSVGYGDFGVIAIKAIQELKKQHDSEIADLKAQIAEIISANKELRSRLSNGTVTASNAK